MPHSYMISSMTYSSYTQERMSTCKALVATKRRRFEGRVRCSPRQVLDIGVCWLLVVKCHHASQRKRLQRLASEAAKDRSKAGHGRQQRRA